MEEKTGHINAKWSSNTRMILVTLQFISFQEDGKYIIFCPALDICGSGNDEKEAEESIHVTLNEFLNYTNHKKTFLSELSRMGWNVKKKNPKVITPPDMSVLLEQNEEFHRIFNKYPFYKFDKTVEVPVC